MISFDADATDADGDTLTYSRHRPAGRAISINTSTGVISGTLSRASAGLPHVSRHRQRRRRRRDTDSFTWTVTDTNQAPVFSTERARPDRRRG